MEGEGAEKVRTRSTKVKGGLLMRLWATLILATMMLGVIMLSGVALAQNNIMGTDGDDVLKGTDRADNLDGGDGNDKVRGKGGRDNIIGGRGPDEMFGGPSDDTIYAADGYADYANCGDGSDAVYVDERDIVNENCETATLTATP